MAKDNRFEVVLREGNGLTSPARTVLMDTVTGVQYLLVQDGNGGGLTVLVDREGKPMTWQV